MGREVSPLRLMVVGFVLLAASWLVALLMVIGQIPKDLLISLGAYAASVLGFGLGMVGAILYVRRGAV